MIGKRDRRANQDQHPVSGEILDGSAEFGNYLAKGVVIFAQQLGYFLWRGGLRKSGEAAQVGRHNRQLNPALLHRASQSILAYEIGELRREEPSQKLSPLTLNDMVTHCAGEKDHLTDRRPDRSPTWP